MVSNGNHGAASCGRPGGKEHTEKGQFLGKTINLVEIGTEHGAGHHGLGSRRGFLTRGRIARAPGQARGLGHELNELVPFLVGGKTAQGGQMGVGAADFGAVVALGHEGHAAAFLGAGTRGLVLHGTQGEAGCTCCQRVKH